MKNRIIGSKLTDQDRQYIMDNHSTLSVNKIRQHLGITHRTVKDFLSSKGIKFESKQDWKKNLSGVYLSDEDKKFIKENSTICTVNELARLTNSSFQTVKRYLVKNNIPFTINKTKPTKKEIEKRLNQNLFKQVIVRPPAQYSNPDYSRMYL